MTGDELAAEHAAEEWVDKQLIPIILGERDGGLVLMGIVTLRYDGKLRKSVGGSSGSRNTRRACRPAPNSGGRGKKGGSGLLT